MLDTSLTKLPRAETSLSDVWRIRALEINSKVGHLKRWQLIAKLLKLVEYLLTGLQYCFPNDTTHLHLLQHSLVLTNLIILTKSFVNPGHDTPGGNSDFVQCNNKLVFHIWHSNLTSLFVDTTFFHDCILFRIVAQGLCKCEGSPHGPCILGCCFFFFVAEGKYKKVLNRSCGKRQVNPFPGQWTMPSLREGTTNLMRYLTKALQCVTITNQGSEGEIQETGGREGEEKGEGENNQNGGQHEDSLPFLNKCVNFLASKPGA